MNLSFLLRLVITAALGGLAYFLLMPYLPEKLQYNNYVYILFFFVITTAVFHFGLERSAASGAKHFIRYYMAATGLKLLLYVAIVIMYAIINKAGMMKFAFCFLLFYVLFTALEVSVAYRQFSKKDESPKQVPD